jgi:hypothetical protein
MERPIEKGDYIRKKNFDRIGKAIAVEVCSISYNDRANVRINGFMWAEPQYLEVVSKEEADRLNELLKTCVISDTIPFDEDMSCFREDTGEPKRKLPQERIAIMKLFSLKMKHPERNLIAYKCDHCGYFHLGKEKIV